MRIRSMQYIHAPALGISEAALLPARMALETRVPIDQPALAQPLQAPQAQNGSVAGRAVLHAAGIQMPGPAHGAGRTNRRRQGKTQPSIQTVYTIEEVMGE